MKINYRDKKTLKNDAKCLEIQSLDQLDIIPKKKLIFWNDSEDLRCLDVDFHGESAPKNVSDLVSRVYPQCQAYDISKRGGLHLYYSSAAGLSAPELCALAYFSAQKVFLTCSGIEILCKSMIVGKVQHIKEQDARPVQIQKIFNSFGRYIDDGALKAVYEHFGISLGEKKRVDTNLCPFARHDLKKDANPSVDVSEDGVYCFRCEMGISLESLASNTGETMLRKYCNNLLWWDIMELYLNNFVRHDLRAMHQEINSKFAYSALLNLVHPNDYRVTWALDRLRLFRDENGVWLSPKGTAYKESEFKSLVRLIPMLNTGGYKKDDDGAPDLSKPYARGKALVKVLPEVFYTTGEDLSEYLPLANVTQGVDFAYRNITETNENVLRCYYQTKPYQFISYPSSKAEKAVQAMETLSDKINTYGRSDERFEPIPAKNLVQLILAQAYTEFNGERPLLVATGVSGSGKTLLPRLASAILRSKCVLCTAGLKPDQRIEAFGTAIFHGATCFIHDEALKDTGPNQYLNMNNAKINTRILFVGYTTLRSRCCSVITGITLPREFKENGQFMRRVTELPHLTTRKDWNASSVEDGYLKDKDIKEAVDNLLAYLSNFLPNEENVPDFCEYWANVEAQIHPFFTDPNPKDEETDTFKSCVDDRFTSILQFLRLVKREGIISNKSRTKNGLFFPKAPASKSWECLQDLFLGLDISRSLPNELVDWFSEYDLSKQFGVKEFNIGITATRDNIVVRLKSNRKIIKFDSIELLAQQESVTT